MEWGGDVSEVALADFKWWSSETGRGHAYSMCDSNDHVLQ